MNKERWQDLKFDLKEKYKPVEETSFELPAEDGGGMVEELIMATPMGRMKLEFTERPLVVDKKVTTSRRIGANAKVDYVYSDTEKSCKLRVFKWEEINGDWEEIKANLFDN